jgi:hypothetical protein
MMALHLIKRLADWCIEKDTGHATPCWIWQGHKDKDGYAELKYRGKKYRANRLSYAVFNGPIEQGNDIDHECRCRDCINPLHLMQRDPITNRVFLRDKREAEDVPF